MSKKSRFDTNIVLVFVVSALLRLAPYLNQFVYRFRTDDFGTLVYPAYLAGYDWSAFVSGTNHYYGFGYYWIFAPLFHLFRKPESLLIAIAAVNSMLIVLSSLLIYHLAVYYLRMPRSWVTACIAIIATMFQGDIYPRSDFWLRTDNEIPLYLAVWLLVWAVLAAADAETRRKKAVSSFLVGLVLVWALTVHERALALVLSVIFVLFLFYLLTRRWVMQPAVFLMTLCGGFVCQRMLRRAVIAVLWRGGLPGKNTDAFADVSLWFLESVKAVRALMLVLFGNIHSFIIRGFGIPVFAMVIAVGWMILCIRNKTWREKGTELTEEQKVLNLSALVLLIFGVCITVTILGMSVRWGSMLYPGLVSGEVVRGYKGICYSRYYYTFIGPVVFGTLVYCCRNQSFERGWVSASWALFGLFELVFYSFVFPYCITADFKAGTNYAKRALGTYVFRGTLEFRRAVSMTIMVVAMLLLTRVLLNGRGDAHRRNRSVGIAALFILIVFAGDRAVQIHTIHPSVSFEEGGAVIKQLTRLQEEDALAGHVYLENKNWSFPVHLTFKEIEFINGSPDEMSMEESNLVIRTQAEKAYTDSGYQEYIFDGQYWLYTNDKNTIHSLEEVQ